MQALSFFKVTFIAHTKAASPEQWNSRFTPDSPFALIPYCISKQLSCSLGHFLTRPCKQQLLSNFPVLGPALVMKCDPGEPLLALEALRPPSPPAHAMYKGLFASSALVVLNYF